MNVNLNRIFSYLNKLGDRRGVLKILKAVRDCPNEAATIALAEFPLIILLNDAPSYGGNGAEISRTLKSLINLARFVMDDKAGLGGERSFDMEAGLTILQNLIFKGLAELGAENGSATEINERYALGLIRMMKILSLHDLGKSEKVARAATALGCSDHDTALARLVQNHFQALENVIDTSQVESLRGIIADPVIYNFFCKPRGISDFNVGRHLQGEAPENLFLRTVRGVTSASLAEFIADWSGVDGHKSLTGPLALAHIPAAVNGTAVALKKLDETPCSTREELWQHFSYPPEELLRLGLPFKSHYDKAVTRVAFMGREHQMTEVGTARNHIEALKTAFAALSQDTQQQLIIELNAPDLDLGFTPHTIEALQDLMKRGEDRKNDDTRSHIYEIFLLALHRVIKQVRALKLSQEVITVNLDNKKNRLADAVGEMRFNQPPAQLISQIEMRITTDSNEVFSVEFNVKDDS